jgi:hypothetical protein
LAPQNVRFDDLPDIFHLDAPVPDTFRVNDHGRTVLALVKTSRLVGAYLMLEPASSQFLLKSKLQLPEPGRIAAAAWVLGRALVAANKDVSFELRHPSNLQETLSESRD